MNMSLFHYLKLYKKHMSNKYSKTTLPSYFNQKKETNNKCINCEVDSNKNVNIIIIYKYPET